MAIFKGKFEISEEKLKYYNDLLLLDLEENSPYYIEEDIERLDARIDDYIGIASIKFENGNVLTIDIASGSSNYFDNIVLYDKNGEELLVLDCDYNIDNFEFEYDGDKYIVEMVVKGGMC